eukprot:11265881-Alexandrium_andersonii.AAC.1
MNRAAPDAQRLMHQTQFGALCRRKLHNAVLGGFRRFQARSCAFRRHCKALLGPARRFWAPSGAFGLRQKAPTGA